MKMMYLLGVLCLVAFTTALPVIPEPPSLPGDVTVHDSVLHTNLPVREDAQKGEHEEKKDENEAEPPKEIVYLSMPEPPMLPPLDGSIYVELIKHEEKEESEGDKDSKNEEDSKIDDDKKVNKQNIPTIPVISNIISTFSNIKWPTSISDIKWPFSIPNIKWPSIFSRSHRIIYPGYVLEVK
ncbi:uncharacterized protein LOC123866597 [Maniola jurtina]|uniref:uncharacterized protein LOC123866597 n=1 Tax=Maniola jurtina TaxID=191418 RepID=UPI001E68A5A3|nr:uncharacterized protein LOC123866597 [Maniola jurtina]